MKENIYRRLSEILSDLQITDINEDIEGKALLANGSVDSLTALQLISRVEECFDVDITDDLNLDCMETVDTLVEFIVDNSATQPGEAR